MLFFFFNDTATTEIYTLSLHDALPISLRPDAVAVAVVDEDGSHYDARQLHGGGIYEAQLPKQPGDYRVEVVYGDGADRKSTRLNSSHANISYAVFCLKKKKINRPSTPT